MIQKKTWAEFRSTGLAVFVNQFLHLFGWAIVWEQDEQGDVIDCYPARCKFRGFDEKTIDEAYHNATYYMKDNANELYEEAGFDQ